MTRHFTPSGRHMPLSANPGDPPVGSRVPDRTPPEQKAPAAQAVAPQPERSTTPMTPEGEKQFRTDLLALVPFLRAFSRSLCGERELADDLAQEALAKAWQSRNTFQAGSNLKAWLFTILRNQFYSDRRRAWRQAPWDESAAERVPAAKGEQTWAVQLSDTARALRNLPHEQREALILVGAGGFSYEEAASISNCAVGTVKSRVARARKALIAQLEGTAALPVEDRPSGKDAANEIMAELDRLAPQEAIDAARNKRRE